MRPYDKERDVVRKEFLKQYPQYSKGNYLFKIELNHRFNRGYSIFIYDGDNYETEFRCKICNNEQETTYEFDEEIGL